MLAVLTPHWQLDSVLDLSVERLQRSGRTGLLLDVDCTLKDYGSHVISAPVLNWIETLRRGGIRMCVLSNGRMSRIEPLANRLRIPFVARAFRPFPFGCWAALRLLELPPEQTAIVGDQVFADVMAGRLARLLTILVRPTTHVEPIWTRIKRPLERFVLKRIDRQRRSQDSHAVSPTAYLS